MNESASLDFKGEIGEKESFLGNFFYISSFFHIVIVFIVYLYNSSFFKLKNRERSFVESFVRVDVVSMPTLTIEELKSLDLDKNFKKNKAKNLNKLEENVQVQKKTLSKAPIKPVPIKREEIKNDLIFKEKTNLKMKKAKKEIKERKIEKVKSEGDEKKGNILDIINSLNNKKVKVLKKVKRRKRPNNNLGVRFGRKSLQTIRNLGVEGNKLSKGENLLEGRVILEEENLRVLSEYISKITKSIRSYWKLPEYLKNNNYRCEIQIFISGDGSLRGLNIKKKSGNDEFDKRVMQTIKMAAPFPLVDKTISKKVLSGDLILGFSEDGIL